MESQKLEEAKGMIVQIEKEVMEMHDYFTEKGYNAGKSFLLGQLYNSSTLDAIHAAVKKSGDKEKLLKCEELIQDFTVMSKSASKNFMELLKLHPESKA